MLEPRTSDQKFLPFKKKIFKKKTNLIYLLSFKKSPRKLPYKITPTKKTEFIVLLGMGYFMD